jgi:cytochrome c556
MMLRSLAVVGLLALAICGPARAQVTISADNLIEARQAGQDMLDGNFDGIRATLAAKGDVTKVADSAKAMARWARNLPTLFPAGTETLHNTKALPTVWSDHAGFVKAANDLADAADKLSAQAKAGDAAGMTDQVKVVGAACGACHRTYRQRS